MYFNAEIYTKRERGENEERWIARVYVYKHGGYGIWNWNAARPSWCAHAARRQTEDGLFWIGGSPPRQRILNRVAASSLDHSHLFGACVALPPLSSAPSTKRSRRRHASMRTPIVAESSLGYRFRGSFFFFFCWWSLVSSKGFVVSCCRLGTALRGIGECRDWFL